MSTVLAVRPPACCRVCRYLAAIDPEVSAKTPTGIQEFRKAAEAALAAAGLHLTEAAALWQEYR
jgi:hypothetical protein